MSNMSNLGLANGFVQGFSLMDNYQARKESRERADKAFQHQEQEWDREEAARLTQAMYQGVMDGNVDPELAKQWEAKTGPVDWNGIVDPQYGKDLYFMKAAVEGKAKINSPEGLAAFNRIYKKDVKRGVGEKVGNKTIVDKAVNRIVPSKDGKSFMLNLAVKEEDPEAGWSVRNAPVTSNRSASDTEVKQVDLDKALSDLKGRLMIYEGIQKSPKILSLLRQRAAKLGAQLPQEEKQWGDVEQVQGLGMTQKGPNGEVKVLRPEDKAQGAETVTINGQLVDKNTGKIIGDYRDEEGGDQLGEVFEHPELGLVQKDKNGKYIQYKSPKAEGKSGMESSDKSQIQTIAKSFHGTFNPDGSFLGIPKGSRERYTKAMSRTETLMQTGYPVFQAANIANLSTLDPLTLEEAGKIADREAEDKDIKGNARSTYVNNRAEQLMAEQNKAHEIWNNLFTPDEEPEQEASQQQGLTVEQDPSANVRSGVVDRSNPAPQKPTRKATPADEQKLVDLLQKHNGDQQAIEKVKEYYVRNFGTLPKGM